ncbi:MAG: ferrous iron transport protein A [Candidatus Thorarchaeota archaeon]
MDTIPDNDSVKTKNKISIIKTLTEIPTGKEFKILRVNAGHHAKERLACLGIVPGVKIIKKKSCSFSRSNRGRSERNMFSTW